MARSIYKKQWFVYIVECSDKTLYTGIARDVKRRVKTHNRPSSDCKYTRMRQPIELVYEEKCRNHRVAWKREREIKKFSRQKKLVIINGLIKASRLAVRKTRSPKKITA